MSREDGTHIGVGIVAAAVTMTVGSVLDWSGGAVGTVLIVAVLGSFVALDLITGRTAKDRSAHTHASH